MTRKTKKKWPGKCVWPEPVESGYGGYWNAEDAEYLPVDDFIEDLLDIKDYVDEMVTSGRLNDDYTLNEDYSDYDSEWVPDEGEDYWSDKSFSIGMLEMDIEDRLNLLKLPLPSPVQKIEDIIGYEFINENLLRQAFTRRSFALEYGLGDNEVLEFTGDSVLDITVTRECVRQSADMVATDTTGPFRTKRGEGELSLIRSGLVNRDYLSKRAVELGLDRYILYGKCEEPSTGAREDMMEALIGAVAVDSGWNWEKIENVVDVLVEVQLSERPDDPHYYEELNSWHQKHFGCVPDYEVYSAQDENVSGKYHCILRYSVPENTKGVDTAQIIEVHKDTRSSARELAAELAVRELRRDGLWIRLEDAGIVPDLDNSINQMQELWQKKYIPEPEYRFEELYDGCWQCTCISGGVNGWGNAHSKTESKKKAAYATLIRLMIASGLADDEMKEKMNDILCDRM